MREKEIRDAIKDIEAIVERKTVKQEKCPTCGQPRLFISTHVPDIKGREHLLGILRGLQTVLGEGELPTIDDYRYAYFPE